MRRPMTGVAVAVAAVAFLFAPAAGPSAAAATDSSQSSWRGPYPSDAICEADVAAWREAGGVASGCTYRDLPYTFNDGWYFRAWPIP